MPGINSGKLAKLLAARRQIQSIPKSASGEVFDDLGRYYPDQKLAIWEDGDRISRRHEVMHGIRDVASKDPELAGALPWWARGGKDGGFEDELLARLAGGDVRDWSMPAYWRDDPLKYSIAMPIHAIASHPEGALAGLVGGGAIVAGAALSAKEPPQRIADQFDRQVGR